MSRYRTIVADPPWDLNTGPPFASGGATRPVPYPTMTVDEIKALPVRALSDNLDDDAHLYLWTVNAYLRDSFDIARAWGFHRTGAMARFAWSSLAGRLRFIKHGHDRVEPNQRPPFGCCLLIWGSL